MKVGGAVPVGCCCEGGKGGIACPFGIGLGEAEAGNGGSGEPDGGKGGRKGGPEDWGGYAPAAVAGKGG